MNEAPTLNLSPNAQKIYAGASADPSVGPQMALAAARQYDQKKADSAAKIASLDQQAQGFKAEAARYGNGTLSGGLHYTLLDKDSDANLTKLAPLAVGAALTPFTGGLSLAGASALVGGGTAAAELARQAGNGESADLLEAGKQGVEQGALNFLGGKAGELVAKGVGAAAGKVGGYLGEKADDLARSSLGLTRSQSGNFWQKTGTNLGEFIKANGLLGKTADDVSVLRQSVQQSYNDIARNSGIKVSVADIRSAFEQNVSKVEGGVSSSSKQVAQAARDEFDAALANLGVDPHDAAATVDIGDLADAKSEYQNNVRWNSPQHDQSLNGLMADTFLDTVNKAAEGMTDAEGNSLRELGQKLRGLNLVEQWSQKAANTVSPAKGPWTLGNLIRPAATTILGAGVGGPVGAVIGAGAGLAGDIAANSPGAVSATSNLYGKAAGVLGTAAEAAAGSTAGRTIGSAAGIGSAPSLSAGPSPAPMQGGSPQSAPGTSQPTASSPSLDLATQGIQALQSGQSLSQDQYRALLQKDLVTTGGRFAEKITAAYQAGNPTGVQSLGVASSAADNVQKLYQEAGGAQGPIRGGIETALGNTGLTAQSVKSYNSQRSALGQEIVSQIYGSSGTAEDRDQILNMIPLITDSQEVAASKMATLRATIQQRLAAMGSATQSTVGASGPSLNLKQ